MSTPQNPQNTLSPPLGLVAKPGNKGEITLTFFSGNDENDFDGFNVYISEIENVADTVAGTTPLIPDGIEPTIRSSFLEIDTNEPITYIVKYRDNKRTPLASGIKYFFIVKAHSSNNYVSRASNESGAKTP